MTTKRNTSRSAQITVQRCKRLGYLSNFYPNNKGIPQGLAKKGISFQVLTGIYVHEGVQQFLLNLKNNVLNDDAMIDTVVKDVLSKYDSEVDENVLQTYGCTFGQVKQEQTMLIEGLLRGWAMKRLPYFAETYEILEVEKDRSFTLVHNDEIDEDVIMEFKPDAIMKHKVTGLIFILSNKTTGSMDKRKLEDARSDIQGLSEIYGVEQTTGLKAHGVLMEYFLTGKKSIDDVDNGFGGTEKQWIQWSPLVRGWYKADEDKYAWRFVWDKLEGGSGRLGKGWLRVHARQTGKSVKEWLAMLNMGETFPSFGKYADPISDQFVSIEYYRNPDDMDEWLESIKQQELEVGKAVKLVNESEGKEYTSNLRKYFPMYRHACNYPLKCQFWEICHGTAGSDPLMNGFVYRTPHHELQLEEME